MTTAEIIALAAAVAMAILIETQIIAIKKDLRREIIMRKVNMRIMRDHVRGLWEDIRAAGIPRFRPEEEDNE
ncbi:MAG: hypothetical protein IKG39_01730 [Lachnospiraceae bacterium]|nr:hypothetical protein [Lachnospiraceae bacterium]